MKTRNFTLSILLTLVAMAPVISNAKQPETEQASKQLKNNKAKKT